MHDHPKGRYKDNVHVNVKLNDSEIIVKYYNLSKDCLQDSSVGKSRTSSRRLIDTDENLLFTLTKQNQCDDVYDITIKNKYNKVIFETSMKAKTRVKVTPRAADQQLKGTLGRWYLFLNVDTEDRISRAKLFLDLPQSTLSGHGFLMERVFHNDPNCHPSEGTNTTDALIMCLHHWLKWLDEGADSVRVISFDYKKAFDSENPCCWDLHIDDLLSKASGRMYILRVCRCYGYSADQLSKLFDSLIMSLFYYCIEVWGSALQKKYLDRIDKFFRRAYRYGYTTKSIKISEVIEEKDRKLFSKIVSNPEHALHELLPVCKQRILRQREHNFILPQIKTERLNDPS
ncbi:Hypothetical predicted protein [Paramuricea clavata]|uniref:Uncharacterized protein n=2 Tax=Paramuricea clavata TaxID=317549 RepID=A0A6S7GPM3_PARCT|nr:Hypothetical predicted protein [Paramuricea clavata]